ncbi:SRPBCC domain-containing protein [Undibacterium sp. TJN19]|uniref:SRPBCC domain-containing protein n=1 Tax=Undibacterium sp. TJN19 TaxID=3413055 RepID=UPI003BF26A8C
MNEDKSNDESNDHNDDAAHQPSPEMQLQQTSVTSAGEFSASRQHKKTLPFSNWFPLVAGALIGVILRLVFSGKPEAAYAAMAGTFVLLVPMAVGATTVFVAECQKRRSWSFYIAAPIIANFLFVLGTMAIFIEGAICAIIIIPLFAVAGAAGGLLMGFICRTTNWPKQALGSFVLLPLLLGAAPASEPDLQRVAVLERSIKIQATPEQIWHQLHHADNIRPDEVGQAWMYRIGVPLPVAGITRASPAGLVRSIKMNKSIHFDQVSSDWAENQYVVWRYHFYADSFPPDALDDHVMIGGRYFDILDTTYSLKPQNAQITELKIQMRYRVSTEFNWYADMVASLLIHNFEEVILNFYQKRAMHDEHLVMAPHLSAEMKSQ